MTHDLTNDGVTNGGDYTREKKKKKMNERKIASRTKTLAYSTARLVTFERKEGGDLNLEIKISIPVSPWKACTKLNERRMMHLGDTVHAKWENFVDLNKKDNKGGLANLILVTTTSPSIFNALGGFFQLDFAESEITCTDSFA